MTKRKRYKATQLERARAMNQRMQLVRVKRELERQDEIIEMLKAIMAQLKVLTLSLRMTDAKRTD